MATATSTEKWIEELKGISVLELAERIKALEEEFGVSAAAMAAPAAAPAGGGGDAAAEEEASSTVDVLLTGAGSSAYAAASVAVAWPGALAVPTTDLLVDAERVLVVDFKTNRPAPDRIEDADPAYLTQMAIYVAVLAEVFPGRSVEAAIVWTDGPKLMPIPEKIVRETLAAIGAGG